jgi:hypothetical protein
MNIEFLVIANVVLLTRLVMLLKDEAPSGFAWLQKCLMEFFALVLLYRFSAAWIGAAATIAAANYAGWRWDAAARQKNSVRLIGGVVGLVLLSVFAAPAMGMKFYSFWSAVCAAVAQRTALAPLFELLGNPKVQLVLFGLLFAANEANLVIRAVFDWLRLKPQLRTGVAGALEVDVGEYNRGRVIGLLERALLYLFVLQGQYGAIGFVLAAKAFTRFKALDDRPFAEYVLVGTLLSACLAVAVGTAVKALLG